jgi:hypothetical protein
MAKRNWPDHIAVGRTIHDGETPVVIVDVKAGPMMFNTSDLATSDVTIRGTLKLRVKYPGGKEVWLPPTEGQMLVDWCEAQDAKGVQA